MADYVLLNLLMQPGNVAVLIASAVFLLSLITFRGLGSMDTIRRRIKTSSPVSGRGQTEALPDPTVEQDNSLGWLLRTGARLSPTDKTVQAQVRKQLIQAGYFSPAALPIFYTVRAVLALVIPIVFVSLTGLLPLELSTNEIFLAAAGIAVAGLIVPGVYLDYRQTAMQLKYRYVFPDFMDLMVVCLEAGQSLQGALDRVSREIMPYSPEMATNLRLTCLELRAGSRLAEAISGLNNRLGIDEVNSLGLLLRQSEELGTSIAGSMRVFSDEMRDKRLMRAETKAHALPVKLTVPLGLFFFPVIMMVIMLPLVIRIKAGFM